MMNIKPIIDKNLIKEALERSVDVIYPSRQELEKVLLSGKRLRIYHGVDPTGPQLHLGHATNLLVLKRFQRLGHEIILLIGDFTARIGDPTDKLAARQPLTKEQVLENAKTYKEQAAKILDFSGKNPVKICFNSEWLEKLNFADLIRLAQNFTVQQMLERDMFQERLKNAKPIGVHEFFYPLMQGYDSVALDVDLEIGGTDQTFNMLVGRSLMKIYKNKEKFVLTTRLLENPKTGRKLMSKSEGGIIGLNDSLDEMFGKIMALDDEAVMPLAKLSTEVDLEEIKSLEKEIAAGNPRDAKLELAEIIASTYHGKEAGEKAKKEFIRIFSQKQKPSEISTLKLKNKHLKLIDLLAETKLAPSKSEARRLILQGGVKIDDAKKTDPEEIIEIKKGIILQVGKRKFVKLSTKD